MYIQYILVYRNNYQASKQLLDRHVVRIVLCISLGTGTLLLLYMLPMTDRQTECGSSGEIVQWGGKNQTAC